MEILPNNIYNMDCLELMKSIPGNSIDAIVTDPPYELGFMGKSWDKSGIANNIELWKEALRILKPGGHLLAFSGTRTYHRMASAIEDAGFEVRDMIEWVYGSGFPKSLNIGKAVDKLQGNQREKIIVPSKAGNSVRRGEGEQGSTYGDAHGGFTDIGKGTSEWEGWGTALKPSHEPICMARKPLEEKTVAENCLKYGTGGINIDESRVETTDSLDGGGTIDKSYYSTVTLTSQPVRGRTGVETGGRFPANLIHDNSEEVRECFPETNASRSIKGGANRKAYQQKEIINPSGWKEVNRIKKDEGHDDNGGNASRYFKSIIYIPKASKSERNKGCEELEEKYINERKDGGKSLVEVSGKRAKNNHPTVKPIALMEYLINMITREGQIILDPFLGSGTTAVACIQTNRQYIGFELLPEYFEIAQKRIDKAIKNSKTLFNLGEG